ncbi:MAG: DNA primase [bacterium]
MAISPETIEKIRQSVDIVDIIGGYVPLKRAGAYYKALSPFNKEKTPSFMVSPGKQSFKCYSSGHGGDVFKFLMLYENVDFPTAVRHLADKAGITITEDAASRAPSSDKAAKESLIRLHNQLALHWRDLLLSDSEAAPARKYLESRRIPLSWVKDFCLGYVPAAWDTSAQWGKKAGFSAQQLLDAGIIIRHESGKLYDRFRNRLMFPIRNEAGQIVAFSGRLMEENKNSPKYVNSPETILFKKSRLLFGFDKAKRAILDAGCAIVCEGQIDVLRCHSAGIANVVAPLGTAFTEEHCRLLKRFTDRMILCLDSDRAGQEAAARLGELLLGSESNLNVLVQSELGIQVILLPAGHDPDSIISQQGAETFRALLAKPVDYLDFYIAQHLKKEGGNAPAARRRVVESVARLLTLVENGVMRDRLATQAAHQLDIAITLLKQEVERLRQRKTSKTPAAEAPSPTATIAMHSLIQELILFVLSGAEMIPEAQRRLHPEWLRDLNGAELLDKIIEAHMNDEWSGPAGLYANVEPHEQNYLAGLVNSAALDALVRLPVAERIKNMEMLMKQMELDYLNRRLTLLAQQIKAAPKNEQKQKDWTVEMGRILERKCLLTRG